MGLRRVSIALLPILIITGIFVKTVFSESFSNSVTRKEVFTNTNNRAVVKNVPYICQIGRLDCSFVSRAMLIEHFNKEFCTLDYPKLVYYSAICYGFAYQPNTLSFPLAIWVGFDENYEWLASLYGLSYKRIKPLDVTNKDKAWNEFINTIWKYLQEGVPIEIRRSWLGRNEENGKIYLDAGIRPFWWESIAKEHRPELHALVIVGLDKSKGLVYVNDPGCGWFGMGKCEEIKLDDFRTMVEAVLPQLRYEAMVFTPSDTPKKNEDTIEEMVKQRIIKRLKGDPQVYDQINSNYLYGLKAIKALRNDLEPGEFFKILKAKMRTQRMQPQEAINFLQLCLYQFSYYTSITAEYLEAEGKTEEWIRVSNLHMLYEKIYVLNGRLLTIFKSCSDFEQAFAKSKPILGEMGKAFDELISFIQNYLKRERGQYA